MSEVNTELKEKRFKFPSKTVKKVFYELLNSSRIKTYLQKSTMVADKCSNLVLEVTAEGVKDYYTTELKEFRKEAIYIDVPCLTYEELTKQKYSDAIREMKEVFDFALENNNLREVNV